MLAVRRGGATNSSRKATGPQQNRLLSPPDEAGAPQEGPGGVPGGLRAILSGSRPRPWRYFLTAQLGSRLLSKGVYNSSTAAVAVAVQRSIETFDSEIGKSDVNRAQTAPNKSLLVTKPAQTRREGHTAVLRSRAVRDVALSAMVQTTDLRRSCSH